MSQQEHPARELDDVVHQRTRLGILTILRGVPAADFVYLKKSLRLSDGNLASHLAVLERVGLIDIAKMQTPDGARTSVSITKPGQKAIDRELAILEEIIGHGFTRKPSALPTTWPTRA